MPSVTRIGDQDAIHCSTPLRAQGSPNVFCNGRAISRESDLNTIHQKPGGKNCVPHAEKLLKGSGTVWVNGLGCGRIGDGINNCTVVAQGSPNVFAGG
ncbi:MAG TPA: hypothetical protein HPP54_08385 [Nitrospinae bacterium]|jgi:uncharacterized Zn-binding protein involved in type VI secretion|nr:hypothetical protein [Nitrospinota bacterium]